MKILTKPKQYILPNKTKPLKSILQPELSQSISNHSLVQSVEGSVSKSVSRDKLGKGVGVGVGVGLEKGRGRGKKGREMERLPNIFMERRIKSSMSKYLDNTITYIKSDNPNNTQSAQSKQQIRKALSNRLNFHQKSPQGTPTNYNFIPNQLLSVLKQPLKTLQYDSTKYRTIYNNIKDILGDDIQLEFKDIIAAYGIVTQKFYVFFTAAYCVPYSLCCREVIYVCVEERDRDVVNRYARKVMVKYVGKDSKDGAGVGADVAVISSFICSKCLQSVLAIECKSVLYQQHSRVLGGGGVKDAQLEAQRHKISMSIIVASGRFKRMRIDQAVARKDSIQVRSPTLQVRYPSKSVTDGHIENSVETQVVKKVKSKYLI